MLRETLIPFPKAISRWGKPDFEEVFLDGTLISQAILDIKEARRNRSTLSWYGSFH